MGSGEGLNGDRRRVRRRGEEGGEGGHLGLVQVPDACAVVDLHAGAEAEGRFLADSVEVRQSMLHHHRMSVSCVHVGTVCSAAHLDEVVFREEDAEDVHGGGGVEPARKLSDGGRSTRNRRPCHRSNALLRAPRPRPYLTPTFIMSTSKAEGRREDALVKQRDQMREDFERQKQTLINETEKARPSTNRFIGQNDSMEDTLKLSTVGLVRLEDFQQRRKELEEAKAREAARTSELKYVTIPF